MSNPQQQTFWFHYFILGVCVFGLSALTTIIFENWNVISTLFYESSLAKYEIMAGERGPTTYIIFHNDFEVLQNMANRYEGILGVEQHDGSNVAKMAFASAKSSLIDEVRQLSVVESMVNRNTPMLCH